MPHCAVATRPQPFEPVSYVMVVRWHVSSVVGNDGLGYRLIVVTRL